MDDTSCINHDGKSRYKQVYQTLRMDTHYLATITAVKPDISAPDDALLANTPSPRSLTSSETTKSMITPSPTGPGTNLGPLTTVYSFPSDCTKFVFTDPADTIYSSAYLAQTCSSGLFIDDLKCWPTTATTVPLTDPPLNGWGYYSPGLICPSGWYQACSATASVINVADFTFQFELPTNATAIGCCPRDYICSYDIDTHQSCRLSLTATTTLTAASCIPKSNDFVTYTTVLVPMESSDTHILSTTGSGEEIWAPMIELVYQSSDLVLNVTSSASISSNPSTSVLPKAESAESSPLSTSTEVGIGIGAAILVLGSCSGLAWLCVRRRRAKARRPTRTKPDLTTGVREEVFTGRHKGVYQGHEMAVFERPQEVPGQSHDGRLVAIQQQFFELPDQSI